MSRFFWLLAGAGLLAAQNGARVWETAGFEAFREGQFDAGGANLYVSRNGVVQTVHRFDVNNDGYYDLIFNNTHDLAYTPPSYQYQFAARQARQTAYPGAGAVRVRVADLNGDGRPELIIARGFDNSTRVMNSWIYWGTPQGWTERYHSELSTPYVQDACVADLNGDGRPDLIFIAGGNYGAHTSYVYWGRENGYFYRARTGWETPHANGCLAADLDADGRADLVVTAAGRDGKVYWDGELSAASPLPVEGAVGAATIGGRLALATAQGVTLFRVRGRAFEAEQNLPFAGAGRLAAGDLNHDGAPDLVVTRAVLDRRWETSSRVYWGRHGSDTLFDPAADLDLPTLGAVDAAIGDVDGDGFADLVFANSRSDRSFDVDSYVYWGAPDGLSPARRTGLPTHGAEGAAAASGSVFFANSVSGRPIGDIDTYVYFGGPQGDYSTERVQRLPTIGGYESCIADLNDDGYTDVLLVGSHEGDLGGTAGSYIYWGAAEGLAVARRSEVPTRGAIGCAIADLDRDGYLDLLFSNMEDNTAQILFGGPQGFHREQNLPVREPRFPAIADLNKDGFLDLLVPSLRDGLVIYWGAASGYDPARRTMIESVGLVSEQVADLNHDGWLDIILCNLMDQERWFFRGINSQILWGGPQGYSPMRRSELPSLGTHHAVVADFNRDGFLDIFLSSYQSEFTRSLDSWLYWGNAGADYTPAHRQALHNESAAGVVAADLNGDGWVDLAVSNHVQNGDHHTRSLIFWNHAGAFDQRRTTSLPTVGPHMMTGVDMGNLYTRALEEIYTSAPYDAGAPVRAAELTWEGAAPFDSSLSFEVRGADTRGGLAGAPWRQAGSPDRRRWWQYRARFHAGRAAWPAQRRVRVRLE
ncbi:MAG TPA: VCBS repeat-containing protein [Bryobacteraceae bacterium]|nr:VCBS repeat-containing protein [Bryobacteraceae bacterium]